MSLIVRNALETITTDLAGKMVFISGPRQVGKTTLARQILSKQNGVYLNWDFPDDKKRILAGAWPEKGVVVLDEIHKYRHWKNFIKGNFDKHNDTLHFLVTGSARMNIYRKGGDSLAGRYHYHRLHPFSMAEVEGTYHLPKPHTKFNLEHSESRDLLDQLLALGGFPEPFLGASRKAARRWHKERLDQVVSQDVRDVSNVHDISLIQLFTSMLPARVGSPLSLNSIREDLNTSHRTISNWFSILQQLYVCYAVPPFTGKMVNALKKEPKVYLWDWSEIEDDSGRFENLIAGHLLKLCHALEDRQGYDVRLWYVRDRQKHEVDFLITENNKPWFAVEAKISEPANTNLPYFKERLKIPFTYCVCRDLKQTYVRNETVYVPAAIFLRSLGV